MALHEVVTHQGRVTAAQVFWDSEVIFHLGDIVHDDRFDVESLVFKVSLVSLATPAGG